MKAEALLDTLDDMQSDVELNTLGITLGDVEAKALRNTFATTLAKGKSNTDVYTLCHLRTNALVDTLVESYQKCRTRQFTTVCVIWTPRHWSPRCLKRPKRGRPRQLVPR